MLGPFNDSSKSWAIVCFHDHLSIQVVVHSSILLVLHWIRKVSFIIRLLTSQRVSGIIRLIIQLEPICVRVLSEQEVLVIQLGIRISQKHIMGSLAFGFNKVLLGHMLQRGVGLCIACDGEKPI